MASHGSICAKGSVAGGRNGLLLPTAKQRRGKCSSAIVANEIIVDDAAGARRTCHRLRRDAHGRSDSGRPLGRPKAPKPPISSLGGRISRSATAVAFTRRGCTICTSDCCTAFLLLRRRRLLQPRRQRRTSRGDSRLVPAPRVLFLMVARAASSNARHRACPGPLSRYGSCASLVTVRSAATGRLMEL